MDGDRARGARARSGSRQVMLPVCRRRCERRAQNIGFGIIAAVMIFAALAVVTTKNVVHAALWLAMVLAGMAAQYILAAAEFVAVSQVMVYIGAVMVLFLFGIMLTRAQIGSESGLNNKSWAHRHPGRRRAVRPARLRRARLHRGQDDRRARTGRDARRADRVRTTRRPRRSPTPSSRPTSPRSSG